MHDPCPRCLRRVLNPLAHYRGGRRETYYKVVRDIRDDPESMHGLDVASLSALLGRAHTHTRPRCALARL